MSANISRYTIAAMYRQSFETVASYGFDKQKMYDELGLNLDALKPEERLDPMEWNEKVWATLTRYIPEDEIAFKIMERFSMGVFGVAGYVILNSPNFIKAFENFVRYTNLHTNMYNLRVQQQNDVQLVFERTLPLMYSDRFNIEMYVLGFTLNILKLVPGKHFPARVYFETPQPKSMRSFEELFGDHTQFYFNAPQSKMVYSGQLTHVPLLNTNEQLYQLFDKMATESLQKISNDGPLSTAVKTELSKRIKGNLPAVEEIAAQLNMSTRSLQLKLKTENTSYRDLADEVRRDIAISHLKNGLLNISEIAYLLGFSEVSSFSSAFKKWTGTPPTSYSLA